VAASAEVSGPFGPELSASGHQLKGAKDPIQTLPLPRSRPRIAEPDLGSRGLRPFSIDLYWLSHKGANPLIKEGDLSFAASAYPFHVDEIHGSAGRALRTTCDRHVISLEEISGVANGQVMPRRGRVKRLGCVPQASLEANYDMGLSNPMPILQPYL